MNEKNIDIIIVDFNLKENDSVNIFGNQILEMINNRYLNFPMFMFTGHELDAINTSDPSIDDLIHEKDSVYENKELMAQRITNKIENYNTKLESAHLEYSALVKKEKLSLEEEEQLLRLDLFLEESHDKTQAKAVLSKRSEYLEELTKLVEKADAILKEIDQNE
ncbi:hypothetical protein [Methanolobus sp.]|uniref:hypothetical protein n=1 Tax=Methanolobus sp. TaxID=1874737 RepID=UPI0025DF7A11|nr:hypothetical protein [Methanolobus sp.]